MELKLKSDTAKRKRFFTAESFAHPAKCHLGLLEWIVFTYTSEGETILDPMLGSGTVLYATLMGRSVVGVELESKFIRMAEDNLKKLNQMPLYLGVGQRGQAQIIQGDARNLEGLLVDKIISSPPYKERHSYPDVERQRRSVEKMKSHPDSKIGGVRIHEHCSENPDNIANLPYGQVDKIISSPPYQNEPTISESYLRIRSETGRDITKPSQRYAKYNQVDSIVTSPPYEEAMGEKHHSPAHERISKDKHWDTTYTERGAEGNIGNLKSDSYLSAMLQVYKGCYSVLKPSGGLLILVTKNFIRNKQIVRLDTDTIKLCEQAGFTYLERHYRKLPAQSFWRIIALIKCDHRKGSKLNPQCALGLECPILPRKQLVAYLLGMEPEERGETIERIEQLCPQYINTSPKINHEDILVFGKEFVKCQVKK